MSINFNAAPYYDDFDDSKNFHRILFKPGYAVQARELTQSQSILQSQISKFADNIFSQNTPVTGGKVTTNLHAYYVKLNLQYNNVDITAADFLNKIVTDSTGSILARVVATAEATGTATNPGDPPTLIVSYISGIMFSDAQTIYPTDGTNIAATTVGVSGGTTCTGLSSTVSISQGVFYVVNGWSLSSVENSDGTYSKYTMGHFVSVQPQTIILDKYSNTPSYRVGLQINETVVDYIDDSSLLDPAIGASNFQAPGADRYKISLTLTTLPLTLGNDDQFIELLRLKTGSVLKQVDGTVYSVINDYIAKRDYETNGDYIVNDFKLTTAANAANNSSKYDITIGKGVAYVHGYRLENQSDLTLTSNRARTTQSVINNDVYIDYGSYFFIDTVTDKGEFFNTTGMGTVDFHCVDANNCSGLTGNSYISTLVGTGYIRDLQYVSANTADSNTFVFKAYVDDIAVNTLTGTVFSSNTNDISIINTNNNFSDTANAYYNMPIKVGNDTRNIVSYTLSGTKRTFIVDQPWTTNPIATTPFTIQMSIPDVECLIYNTGTSSSPTVKSTAMINATSGKVNGINTGDAILYNYGSPELLFNVGESKVASLSNTSYTSKMMWRNQSASSGSLILNITSPFTFAGSYSSPTLESSVIVQNYIVVNNTTGKFVDFNAVGNSVGLSNLGTTATFTLSGNPSSVTIIAVLNVNDASTSVVLKPKNLITGNTSVLSSSLGTVTGSIKIDLTKGQTYIPQSSVSATNSISLYVADLKQVTKIYDTGSSSTPSGGTLLSTYTDVTSRFVVNDGQKDSFYDHAYIKLIPGATPPKGGLVVVYDWYTHIGVGSVTNTSSGTTSDGYFSVLSYLGTADGGISASPDQYRNIKTYSSLDGKIYALTDCLDFRPVRKSGVSTFGLEYKLSTSTANYGYLIPSDLTQFKNSYSYYLPRRDLLVLSKDKNFQIIQGSPAVNPVYPVEPEGSLLLANLDLDAYTSYVPGEAPAGVIADLSLTKVSHNRWAKSDISGLQTRINNLEYYTSLSLLEQNAQSLQVPDVNGLNRFKNGILVDDFSSFATADTANQDFMANIDVRNKTLSAISHVDNFQLHNLIVNNSLGTLNLINGVRVHTVIGTSSNFYTLDYTTANVVVQPIASSAISLNPFSVVTHEGIAHLIPPMDNWVDNEQAPSIMITDPSMKVYQQDGGKNITNSGDWSTIPGTSTTKTSTVNQINHTNQNWGFGTGIGKSTTTTDTYASQLQNQTSTSGYSQLPNSMQTVGNFITNVSVLPYIRSQQLLFKIRGMSVNTPVYPFFDGIDVSKYISTLDVIELSSVSGSFSENDIVGFYENSVFYPIARVGGIYVYPGTTNVRLYVAALSGIPTFSDTTTLMVGTYDSNGNYIDTHTSPKAQGTIRADILPIASKGEIVGVGGQYAIDKTSSAQIPIFKVKNPNKWNSFLNLYGVWKNAKQTSGVYNPTFNITIPEAGVYTFAVSVFYGGTTPSTITFDGSLVSFNGSTNITKIATKNDAPLTKEITVASSGVKTLSWNVTSSTGTSAGIALIVVDSKGDVVFQSTSPSNLSHTGVATETLMSGGGAWFTGVTTIKLDPKSSSGASDDYVGTEIHITSNYAYDHVIESVTVSPPPLPPAPSTPVAPPVKAQPTNYTKVTGTNPPINKKVTNTHGAAPSKPKTVTKPAPGKGLIGKITGIKPK